jgi:hypothetical protein
MLIIPASAFIAERLNLVAVISIRGISTKREGANGADFWHVLTRSINPIAAMARHAHRTDDGKCFGNIKAIVTGAAIAARIAIPPAAPSCERSILEVSAIGPKRSFIEPRMIRIGYPFEHAASGDVRWSIHLRWLR